MTDRDHQMPKDPDPKAAERVARERVDELAAQLGVAEVVGLEEAVDALVVIEDCTSEPQLLSDEVLLSAARRYLGLRRSSGEEPDPRRFSARCKQNWPSRASEKRSRLI